MNNTKKFFKKKVVKNIKYGGGKKRSELIHKWISDHFYNNSKNTSSGKLTKRVSISPPSPISPPKLPTNLTEEKDILFIVQNLVNDNATIFVEFFKGFTEHSDNKNNTDDNNGGFNLLNAIDAHINLLTILKIKTEIDIDTTSNDTTVKDTISIDTISKDTAELNKILKELLTHFNEKFEYIKKDDGYYYINFLIIPNWIPLNKSIKFRDVSEFLNKIKQYMKAAITFCSWTRQCSAPIIRLLNMYINCDIDTDYTNSYKLFKKILLQFINENNTDDKFSNIIKDIKSSNYQSAGRKKILKKNTKKNTKKK